VGAEMVTVVWMRGVDAGRGRGGSMWLEGEGGRQRHGAEVCQWGKRRHGPWSRSRNLEWTAARVRGVDKDRARGRGGGCAMVERCNYCNSGSCMGVRLGVR